MPASSPPISTGTANDRFKESSVVITANGLIVAAVIHFTLFALFPRMTAADMGLLMDAELSFIAPPPAPPLPPEPERIPRPANPVFSADVDANVTLPPTDIEAWSAVDLAPPSPRAGADIADGPVFVPMTLRPRLLNADEVQRTLVRNYPATLRDAGIGGTVMVWVFIDEEGAVLDARVHTSSERPQLDAAALRVAQSMRFSPARNRDQRVRVWVAQPIRFESRE